MHVYETWFFTVKDAYDRGAEESIWTHRKKNYKDRKNYTMSRLRYLTSVSDTIPVIILRRTGWVQLPALIGGTENLYILNWKIGKEKNSCETKP
jgi:hypothetical protein